MSAPVETCHQCTLATDECPCGPYEPTELAIDSCSNAENLRKEARRHVGRAMVLVQRVKAGCEDGAVPDARDMERIARVLRRSDLVLECLSWEIPAAAQSAINCSKQ